jgi:uncharacterized protein DUF6916
MTTSRRKFLKNGMVAAVCAGLPLSSMGVVNPRLATATGSPTPTQSLADPLSGFTMATFVGAMRTRFRWSPTVSQTVTLVLVDVRDVAGDTSAATSGECFSLLFKTARTGGRLTQGTYRLEHASLGTFDLFIVPSGADARAYYYEAIINRRLS